MNCNPERGSWHDEMSVIEEIVLTQTKKFVAVMSTLLNKSNEKVIWPELFNVKQNTQKVFSVKLSKIISQNFSIF